MAARIGISSTARQVTKVSSQSQTKIGKRYLIQTDWSAALPHTPKSCLFRESHSHRFPLRFRDQAIKKEKVKRDFFGRVIEAKPKPTMSQMTASQREDRKTQETSFTRLVCYR
jgi:hypothetical protein